MGDPRCDHEHGRECVGVDVQDCELGCESDRVRVGVRGRELKYGRVRVCEKSRDYDHGRVGDRDCYGCVNDRGWSGRDRGRVRACERDHESETEVGDPPE